MTPQNVKQNLKALRKKAMLSQYELAALSGLSRLTITYMEGGKWNNLRTESIDAIAKALGVPPWILCAEPNLMPHLLEEHVDGVV